MRLKALSAALVSVMALSGCPGLIPQPQQTPLFTDVVRRPPLVKPATVEYLGRNDEDLFVWVLEIAAACDDYGCV